MKTRMKSLSSLIEVRRRNLGSDIKNFLLLPKKCKHCRLFLSLIKVHTGRYTVDRTLRQSEEGRNGVDGQALFVPAALGQQGEQEAQCSPRSALPLPTRLVLLGLAKELPENLWLRRAL